MESSNSQNNLLYVLAFISGTIFGGLLAMMATPVRGSDARMRARTLAGDLGDPVKIRATTTARSAKQLATTGVERTAAVASNTRLLVIRRTNESGPMENELVVTDSTDEHHTLA